MMKKKILAVDDNRDILELITNILEEKGHQVLTAEDGFSALNCLVSYTPDIIFIDFVMPLIGGEKLCKILRKMQHLQDCYLVVVSAAACEIDFDFREIGADACIAKGSSDSFCNNIMAAVEESESFQRDTQDRKIKGINKVYPRQMTRELLGRNRHLETMLESLTDGIVEIFQGKIVYANSRAVFLFGIPLEKILFSNFIDLFNQKEQICVKKLLDQTDGFTDDTDTKKPVYLNGRLVEIKRQLVQGDANTSIFVITDITEREQAKKELNKYKDHLEFLVDKRTAELAKTNELLRKEMDRRIQAEKMEAIGLLAGEVAHDLNNILSGLVSYPDLILTELPQGFLRNAIITIKKSGEKAAAVVQDLLTLARRGVALKSLIVLNEIISEYLKSPEYNKLKSRHPKVELVTDFQEDIFNMKGSPSHISMTVMNLVSNAMESMPDGGKVFISTKNQYVDKLIRGSDNVKEGEYIVFKISDSGSGISKENIKKIFDPFYTRKVMGISGTGLGMSVVWGTVKDHKGYIDVRSSEGKGTTFTLYFPATREKDNIADSHLSIKDLTGKKESILVVDDKKDQREIASRILEKLGYRVTSVPSGEAAVDYLKNNTADLLVLDMIMDPGIDGLETYRRILELYPEQKAVITSGFSETDKVKELQRLGAGSYIKKPYSLEKLGTVIRTELSGI